MLEIILAVFVYFFIGFKMVEILPDGVTLPEKMPCVIFWPIIMLIGLCLSFYDLVKKR